MVIQPPSTQVSTRRPLNATPPTFEKPPVGGRFIDGGDAHFECRVRGNPTPEVVWSRRGMPIKNDSRRQVSYNPTTGICTFDIKALAPEDYGEYTCTAVNCAGEAALTVSIQREFTGQMVSQDTQRTQKTQIQTGKQVTSMQQQRVTGTYMQRHVEGFYQRTSSGDYEIESGSPMYYSGSEGFRVDTFEYRLLREVEFREILFHRLPGEEIQKEEEYVLDSSQPPSAPQIQGRPRNSKLLEGSEASFQAKISGNPRPKITWFRNGQRLIQSQRFKMTYTDNMATLHIHMVLPEDAGYYTLLAENTNGRIACSAHLVIEGVGAVPDTRMTGYQRSDSETTQQRIMPLSTQTFTQTQNVQFGAQAQQMYTQQRTFQHSQQTQASQLTYAQQQQVQQQQVQQQQVQQQQVQQQQMQQQQIQQQQLQQQQYQQTQQQQLQQQQYAQQQQIYQSSQAAMANGYQSVSSFTSFPREPSSQAQPPRGVENDVDVGTSKSLKPNFVKIPSDKEVTEGKMVRFDCRVSGRPFPDVTWYLNGNQVIDDATHKVLVNEGGVHSLMITITSRTDSGTYTCVAKNKSGESRFDVNLIVIEKEQIVAPKFVERFQSLHVKEGEPVTLHCRAVGTPIPALTWQKDGVHLISQPPDIIIETMEGASTLYVNRITILDSAWYQCTAQNQAGSTATRARLYVESELTPMPEPWRLNLPRPQKVIEPEGSPPREVVWLKPVERAQPKQRPVEEERPPQKPAFTTHLQDLNLYEGERANFDARLVPIGDPTMIIEWYVNGKPVEASSRVMTTYRFGYVALTLLHVYPEDSGVYLCRAINEAGEATTTATLRCVPRAPIERAPQHPESMDAIRHLEDYEKYKRQESVEEFISLQMPVFIRPLSHLDNLQEGGFAHFEAQITPVSDPTMKVEWFFNGKPLTAGTRISTTFSFGYVALNISHIRAEDSGVYMCKATNQKGEAISTATLKVRASEQVTASLGIPEQERYIEKTQELEAYQLQHRQTFVEVDQTVRQKPNFRTQLLDKLDVAEGRTAHFEARLEPTGDSTMRVEWLKDGKPVEASSRITTFFNFGYVSLTIRGVDARDTGTYTCVATNSMGTTSTTAKLICTSKKSVVLESQHPEGLQKIQHLEDSSRYQREIFEDVTFTKKPNFTEQLTGTTQLIEGQSAHFETRLEPMGDPSMVVEWYFNGQPLTTGHRFRTYFDFGYVALDILYVFPEDTGTFTVVAKNHLGEARLSKQVHVQAKSSVDTSTIHEIEEKIEYLERPPHQEPQYNIEEISKSKPFFPIPLHNPKPLKEGERVHLECRVEPVGDQTMRIEWFFNGKPLPTGSRFQTKYDFGLVCLDITTAYAHDTGEYTIRATNHLGSAHTSACITVIGKSGVVSETQHPEGLEKIQHLEDSSRYKRDQFEETVITQIPTFTKPLHNIETIEGTNIHLECRLTPVGDPTMKIEWLVNGAPLKVGHRFRPAFEFDYVALDILSVYAEDSGVYTCVATSSLGQAVTSCTVKCIGRSQIISESQHPEGLQQIQYLEDSSRYQRDIWVEESVKIQPKFITKLTNLNLVEGQLAHFECRLEPINDSTLRIEWFRNGKSLPVGHRYRPFHDFGYVALNILSVVPEDSGTYTCRAVNIIGTAEIQATLTCQGKSSIISETQHPEGLEKIQQLEDYSRYTRDKYQEEIITQAPVFTSAPHSVEVKEGQRVHFECRLIPVGDPKLRVEWFHNGKPITTGTRFVETLNFGYVALDIMHAIAEDSGTYTCKAINNLGEAVTSVTLKCYGKSGLILESQQPESLEKIQILEDASRHQRTTYIEDRTTQAPVFTQAMKNLQLQENQSAHFECRLIPVGDPKLRVEWFHNGVAIMPATRVTMTHDFGFVALDLTYVKPEDSGTYTCKATNELGQAVCSATLAVRGSKSLLLETQHPEGLQKIQYLEDSSRFQRDIQEDVRVTSAPVFITPLSGPTKLVEGHSSHLECRIEPYPDPTMKIEWFYNGKPLPSGSRYRTMFDFGFAALDILSVNAEDSGEYTIKATNSLGTSSSSARIQITAKSSLILESQQPDSLQKIQMLEDTSRYRRTDEQEIDFEKPNFGRPLYNIDNLIEGQSAHLEATLTPVNDPTMKVEWFFNGNPIKQAHRFKTTCDFGFVALDILYVFAEDSGTYMCKATNRKGEAVTTCSIKVQAKGSIYTDTLHEEGLEKIRALESQYVPRKEEAAVPMTRPIFITPLKSQENIKEGQPVHLECKLEPVNDPKLKVEWYVNGIEIKTGHRFKTIHDFGYVALDILYSYPEDNGTYMCKAVNEMGEAVTTCTVKIEARRSIYYDTQHPEGLEKIRELECQTKYRPMEVEEKAPCKPYFVSELRGRTEYTEGDSAHLECRVEPSYDSELKIEFFHNGKLLEAGSRFHITFDFGYVALDISHVLPEDTGTYTVKAKNNLGECTSTINIRVQSKSSVISETQHPEGLVKIQALEDESRQRPVDYTEKRTFQRPVFTAPLQNLDMMAEGQSAHLECRLIPVGDPTLKVEWFFNEKPLQPSSRLQTTHDFGYVALDIQYVRPDDTGIYMCRATNELGEAVTTASMKVQTKAFIELQTQHPGGLEKIQELESAKLAPGLEEPEKMYERPVFTTPLCGPPETIEGQPAHFECRVVPIGDPNLKIQWFVNGTELKSAARFRTLHDFGMVCLDITSTIPEDSGVYMCKAVNKVGEAVTSTSMTVRGRQGVFGDSQHPETYKLTQKFEFAPVPEMAEFAKPVQAPIFTQQLTSYDKLIEGQYIHLEARVEPTNDEKLRIEWYKNGKTLVFGTRIRTTYDFGLVALDIVTVRPDDSGIYTCRAVNEVGEAITTCTMKVEDRESIIYGSQHPESLPKIKELESMQLVSPEYREPIYETPVFITHLNNLELKEGEAAHFECRVEPFKDPTLQIEFTLNGKPLPAATRFTVTKDFGYVTLDISHVLSEDAGIYSCKATNNKGQAVTTGSLKVIGDKEKVIERTTHPMGQEGLSKVREVEEEILSRYQTRIDDKEIQFPKPVFVVPLQDRYEVQEGQPLRLDCRVEPSSDPRLTIEWYFNGKSLSLGTRYHLTNDFGQVVLDVSDMWPRDSGVYTCRAFNAMGEAFTSTTIQTIAKSTIYEGTLHPEGEKGLESIQVLEESLMRPVGGELPEEEGHPPVFTSHFQNLTNLTEDDIAHFEATLTPAGDQTMVVEWFFRGQALKAGHRIRTVHAFGMVVLEILGVYIEDSGEYTCRATNKWGRAEITVKLECVDRSRGQKPHFTTQLQSLTNLKEGQSAHFECHLIPVGDPQLRVEWFHNGQPMRHSSRIKTLSDFGYVVMDISFVHVEDSGEYVCVATNKFGSDTTRCTIQCTGHGKIFRDSLQPQSLEKIAELEGSHVQYRSQLSVESVVTQAPKFTTQIKPIPNVVEGQSAHFEAYLTPTNDPNLKVEWYFNGKLLGAGHRFRTFHDFGIVILDILYCYGEDSGEYMCKATNRFGTDTTKTTITCRSKSSIILEPQLPPEMAAGNERIMQLEESLYRSRGQYIEELQREAPRFTVPLENLTDLREGENAHLEARLIPTDDPDLKVEWFKNGKTFRAGTRIRTINDFGFVVLEISPIYPEDSGLYSCRATNKLGEAVTTCTIKCEGKRSIILDTQLPEGMESMEKIARFEDLSSSRISEQWMDVEVSQPPKFITKPQDLTLPENSLAHFECRLTPVSDPTMKVEWFHNGKALITGTRVKTINDFGFVILEVAGVFSRDTGVYVCKATNRHGEASVSAKLTVKVKQSVIMEPQLPSEWRSGTESLQRLEEAMYRTEEVFVDDDKKQPPKFITQIQNLDNKVEGESSHFECRLEPVGDPTMRVEWFLNGKPLTTGTRVHTIDDFGFVVLDIDWLFPRDAGEYMCRATNRWGSDTTKAVLKIKSKRDIIMDSQLPEGMDADKLRELEFPPVQEPPPEDARPIPPKFITQIQPQENLLEGESAHFECRLEPVNDPKLRVEWYHNGKPLKSGHRFKSTHDFGFVALDVLYVYAEDSGEYIARAVNDYGEDVTKATLKIKAKPVLEYHTQLPKSMETGVQKIAEMEASWQRVESIEDVPPERCRPTFVMKPEPQVVTEGEWAKFCCRVIGNPKPRLMWILNGNTVVSGSRYKLSYDGIYHLDVPKSRQYDQGKVEVFARNALGEAYCWTTLEVRPRHDDYRVVLKNSPRHYVPKQPGWVVQLESKKKEEELRPVAPTFEMPLRNTFVKQIGNKVTLECIVKGNPRPKVTWYHNEKAIDVTSGYFVVSHLEDRTLLIILRVTKDYEGKYTCRAVNEHGEEITTAYLYVGVTREEHEALERERKTQETTKKPKKPKVMKGKDEITAMHTTRQLKVDKTVQESADVTLTTQQHIEVQQITAQETPSTVTPAKKPTMEKAEVELVISSQQTVTVSEVQTGEVEKDFKPTEIPGSRKLDFTIPSELATQVSEVLAHGSLSDFRPGELPGTQTADVIIPAELAMQVLEVLENSALGEMKSEEFPGSKLADVSIPSELATQVMEVLATSSISDLIIAERPGSRQADVDIPTDYATQISEVVTHSSVVDLKEGEVPGSQEAKFSVNPELAMQVSEITTQGSLSEMKEDMPNLMSARVTIPSELATQVFEVLSSSSLSNLSTEEMPGSRRVDVVMPSELAMQVYETLAHSSVSDIKPGEVPGSMTASVGLVEKLSVQVCQVTPQHGLSDMKVEQPVPRKATETARPDLPIAEKTEAADVLEEVPAPLEEVKAPVEKTIEETEVAEVKIRKKEITEEKEEKAVVKMKRKPSVKKPEEKEEIVTEDTTQIVLKRKPVPEETPKIEEKITIAPKKEEKPILEEVTEEQLKLKIPKKLKPEIKEDVEETAKITVRKEEKVSEIVEEKVDVTVKKKPKDEEKVTEIVEEKVDVTVKKKPKDTEKKVEQITTEVSLKKKKKIKPEKDETVEEQFKIEPKPKEEAPVQEAQVTLKPKKTTVEEEKPKDEETVCAVTVPTKPKEVTKVEDEASLAIKRKTEQSYVFAEESVDVTVKKEIIVERVAYEVQKTVIEDVTPKKLEPVTLEPKIAEETKVLEDTEEVTVLKPAKIPEKVEAVTEMVTMKAVEVQQEVSEISAQITVTEKVEEKVVEAEEKPVTKRIKLPKKPLEEETVKIKPKPEVKEDIETYEEIKVPKKKPEEKPESPVKETFSVPLKEKEEPSEEIFDVKITPKKKEPDEVVEKPAEVTIRPEEPKEYAVTEEKAEITIKKKDDKEVTQTTVLKKKKLPKKEEQKDISAEIKLGRPKIVEEKPEETGVEETFAIKMPKKEIKHDVVEESVAVDISKHVEKDYTITEEETEVTVKKEIIVEEKFVEDVKKPIITTVQEKMTPKIEEIEEITVKPIAKKEEPVTEEVKIVKKPKPKKPESPVKEEEPVIEEVKLAKKPKPKKAESPIKEEFAVVLPKKEVPKEEKPVEESFVVEIPKPEKKEEVVEESLKFTVEKKEVKEYKIETEEAKVTVKKEAVEETRPLLKDEKPKPVEETKPEPKQEKPIEKEEVALTKTLKLKKKPEVKPSEKPVEESFEIPFQKKPELPEETKEEVFAVVLPEKPKVEKRPEDVVESFELVVKETKPETKSVEIVEEKLTVVVQKEEVVKEEEKIEHVILPTKKIVEEEDQKAILKIKRKRKEKDTVEAETFKTPDESVSETFEIPLEKKPQAEEPVEEKFTIEMPKKPKKVQEEVEEELKVIVPEKKETEYKVTEESATVTVKKEIEEKITKEEEKEVAVVLKKKKPDKEPKEPVVEEFKIPKKPKEKEEKEEEPTKISVELPKRKITPKAPVEEEETFKLELPSEKKFEVVEERAEVTVKKEVEVEEVDQKITLKKPEKKIIEAKEESVVLKKKKKEEKKVTEMVTEEFKIPKKPEEKEPEEETKIVIDLPKKKKIPEVVEEEESLKITLPTEGKPKVVEEAAEITVKKEFEPEEEKKEVVIKKPKKKIVQEEEKTVVIKKKEAEKKVQETVVEEFKIPKKPEEDVPEEPVKLTAALPKKKKVPEVTEEEESLKIVLPHERKPEIKEEEAEVTIVKKVEEDVRKEVTIKKVEKKVVEEKEETLVLKKRKEQKKKVEEQVTEEFKIPKKPEEKVEPEELTQVLLELPKKKKAPKYVEEDESLKITLPSKKEPEVTEESAEITVKKEVVVDEEERKVTIVKKEKERKVEEEKVEFAIKRPKKKPEPKETPMEETFTIGRKPVAVPEPEEPKDVEETFKIVAKPKPKPKFVAEDEEESISIQIPAEKPKFKSEEVSEETKITLEAPKKPEEKEVEMIKETVELIAVSSFIAEKTDTLSIVEGERVYLIEKTSSDWWFVKKTLTNESGYIPSNILQDSDSYTHYMKETLDKKIEKLPVLRKPRPGEKMTGPKFVKKLQPLRVLDGQTAELTCQVSGNPRPTITWFRQTAIIKPSSEFQIFYDDENVTTLIIREVFPEDAGTFTVVAKNAAGFSSCSTELIVEAPLSDHGTEITPLSRRSLSRQSSLADILEGIPPVFSEKPKDKLVEEGKPVEMVCKVTGVPEPKVTWLRNQKLLKKTERIEIETISEDLDTVKVVVTIKKTKPEDAGTYDIIAENREGKSVTSLILNIKEKPKPKEEPPAFIQTYSDLITTEKDSVTLTVKVLGSPPPEVTWYKNGKVIKPSKTTKITQEKDVHTLTIPASSVTDTGEYKCLATNPQGKTEHTAKITVQKTDVDFVDKLNDLEVNERETAMFVVQVSHPDAEVTWHKDGERIKETEKFKIVKEGKFRKLIINDASVNEEGEYTCVLGEKECTADLVVVELPPDFKGEMNDVTVAKEETATFQVELTKGDARARWFKNGKEIQFSEHVLLKIDGKRQKLIIYNATFEDAGTYTCAVGEKKRTAKLKVEAPTVEFTAKLPEKVLVPQDTDATFTVELSRPDVEVKWLKNGQPVPEKDDKFRFIREKNTFKMVVQGVQKDDTAEYTCVAGNVKTSTKLQVQEASAEFTLKLRDVIVKESDTAILLVEVTRETFEVRWMKDGQTIRPSERVVMEREGCRRRLIIKETSLDDKGLYTCVLEEKMCSSTLTVEATPRVTTEKRNFSGKRGSNVPIPIEFVALPSPKIEWLYKGKPVTNDKKHTIENYSTKTVLTVKKIEDADVGNYVLKLSNKCGDCKTELTMSIIDKPKPPGTPVASEVANDSLTLSWKVPESDGGSPVTNYIIEYHDRNTLRWSVYNEKHTITDSFTRVTKLKSGEEYMFRIIAVNEVGKSDPSPGTKYILVKEPSAGEPPAVVEHLQPVVAGLKKPATMKCRISGQPTPTIKWLKNGKDLLIMKNITTTYENQIATLNIKETTEKSPGTYACTATNPLGTVETSAELKIQEPPSISYDENLKNVRLKSTSEYILSVKVFGFPSPEIVWLKNGRVLESTRHALIQVREDSTSITIRQVENTDSGTYTLQLSNPAGTTKYDFRLYVLDKPLPPEGPIAFHKIDRDSVTIGWQPPSIGGSEVLSYTIERCETKRKTWIEVTSVTSGVLTCTISNLTEGVEYSFRVLAVNEYGRSEPLTSDPVIPKSLFNKPLPPKGPFTSSNMTPTSFTLSWLAPDNDGGSPIIEYIVERKEVTKKAWQKVGTTDGRSLSMEVTGLKKDTAYNFRVSCRNEVGTSPPFAPEEAITPGLKISPPSPPEGPLAIIHMTNKTLTLSWKPPTNTGGAELTAYIIEKREATKKAWNRLETLDPHITTYTVHNLSDKYEYFFRVFAENPAGLSPPLVTEKPIKLTSTAERPSPPTAPLEMVATGPSSILIEWGKPESDGGSPILGYTVALRNTRRIMWMEVGQVDGETQKLQIKDLQEGHEYLVRIMARNEIGISDPLEPEEPVKVVRPVGFKESEKMEIDEKTISVSYSTETSSSWIREANVEPLLRSYTKHVLVGRNEYFFKLWHFSESLYK